MNDRDRKIHEEVKAYYSELTNQKNGELASSVCSCSPDSMPEPVKRIVAELPDEIIAKYYGCGSPVPDKISGCTVLDLGCGTGRDVFTASRLVGENGRVIGIDMNEDQLAVARKYREEIAEKWGYSNIVFKKGYIEDLASAGISDKSVDVVISNCVINLSPDKESVFSEISRVLKDGGVLYFSDIFSDRKVPEDIDSDPLILGECLGGCMSQKEFREIMDKNGLDYTLVSSYETPIDNEEIEALVSGIRYTSETIRAVKKGSGCCLDEAAIAVPYKNKTEQTSSRCCCSNGCCD